MEPDNWEPDNWGSKDNEDYISASHAISYRSYLNQGIAQVGFWRKAKSFSSRVAEVYKTNGYVEFNEKEVCQIWSGVNQLYPELQLPKNAFKHEIERNLVTNSRDIYAWVVLKHEFFDKLFSPLLPDSPILNFALSRHNYSNKYVWRLIHTATIIGLTIESILRLLANCLIARALDLFSLKNKGIAEYYRFRLYYNASDPATVVLRTLVHSSPMENSFGEESY